MQVNAIERDVRYLVGQCPMCKTRIYAAVNLTIDLTLSDLGFTSGEATVNVSGKPTIQRASIHHDCPESEARA